MVTVAAWMRIGSPPLVLVAMASAMLCALAPRESAAAKTQVRGITATLEAGEKLAQQGRYPDAERAFRAVLKHKPDSARALHDLGTLLPELGRQAEGLSALRQVAAIAPTNPSVHYSLGRAQASADQHASAVESLRRASALLNEATSPDSTLSTSVLQGLGASLLHLGRYAEALDASDSFPYLQLPARALSNRASALLHLGRVAVALDTWDAAVAASPQDLSLLALRASALRKLDRGKDAAESLLVVLREMVDNRRRDTELYELTLSDTFDDATYSLQEWQQGDEWSRAKVALPLWRELLELVRKAAPQLPVRGKQDSIGTTGEAGVGGGAEDVDRNIYSEAEEKSLTRVWNPEWARNESKLAEIRAALAAGRVVQIYNAVNHDLALALRDELRSATALVRADGHGSDSGGVPIQRQYEAGHESDAVTDLQRDDLDEIAQRVLYADVLSTVETKAGTTADSMDGAVGKGRGVCGSARAAYNQTFRMRVHRTAPDAYGGADSCAAGAGVSFADWPVADASQVLHDVLHSTAMLLLVSDLLSELEAGQAATQSGVRKIRANTTDLLSVAKSLVPIVQATSLKPGDYLTPHNDLLATSGLGGSNRRLAFVLQLSDGWERRCGGAFVWCDPLEIMAPEFNTLTLFPTSHFSWHFVEPVWSNTTASANCDAGHRLAWSGWFAATATRHEDLGARGSDLTSSLGWLRNRMEAYVARQEATTISPGYGGTIAKASALRVGAT